VLYIFGDLVAVGSTVSLIHGRSGRRTRNIRFSPRFARGADGEATRSRSVFVIITVLLCAGSLNLSAVVEAQNTHGLASLIGLPS